MSVLCGLMLLDLDSVANATLITGDVWEENDVKIDANVLTININPEQNFFQTIGYHGGWFLLDSTADSITVSAEMLTWDAKPWDVAYWGITQAGSTIADFKAGTGNTFSGLSWSDGKVESIRMDT
ncbi:MAG TPA: hypothetical protein EYG99_02250, partial [Candidatus Pacebacteria bacterium]|nr:hypothetical protein [Candidatus Paceibacterota bacterium]